MPIMHCLNEFSYFTVSIIYTSLFLIMIIIIIIIIIIIYKKNKNKNIKN